MSALRQLLDFADALGLDLVQGFAAGQPHVVHALGVGDPQAAALTSSQQQRPHAALGDLQQSWPVKGSLSECTLLLHQENLLQLTQNKQPVDLVTLAVLMFDSLQLLRALSGGQ